MDEHSAHYTVLARRYRPQAFDEVIGQESVTRGLANAIKSGRVAHAYLFTGARGVGKTSMARILAKALNCPEAVDAVPCHACETCQAIVGGHDLDVLEIDGASNRGIDDIRNLRRNIGLRSMRSRYKIYIIDEVHQITREAFNALLKTLEEPPENVKFIFCTTDPGRLPETILSRCQRFDFAMIATDAIAVRLAEIVEAEGMTIQPEALDVVARRAGGSLRDSQSLLDQLLAAAEGEISAADVHRLLGTAGDERLLDIVAAVVEQRTAIGLELLDRAIADGVAAEELLNQLIDCWRDMLILAAGADEVDLVSIGPAHRKRLGELAETGGLETILVAQQVLVDARDRTRLARSPRALVDLAVARVANLERLVDIATIIERLDASTSPAISSTEKKKPLSVAPPVVENESQSVAIAGRDDDADAERSENQSMPTTIPLEPGSEPRIWQQVLSRITDMLRDHIGCVERTAISGPNRLDVMFPGRYHFHKSYCERPNELSRLEATVEQITGHAVQLRLVIEQKDEVAPVETERDAASVESLVPSDEDVSDELVAQVRTLFGATIERVSPVNRRGREGD